MMYLKGTISWEGLCYSCGYLVAMVTTDILKMYPKSHDYFWVLHIRNPFLENECHFHGDIG